jgi:hypothetical protein
MRHLGFIDDDLGGWAEDAGMTVAGLPYRELSAQPASDPRR